MFCKDCKYLVGKVSNYGYVFSYPYCKLIGTKGVETGKNRFINLHVNPDADYCSFGQAKEVEQ